MFWDEYDASDGRKGFTMMKNTSGASIAKGKAVSILETQSKDVEIKAAASVADGSALVGITMEAIADNQFGKVQTYGIVPISITTDGTNAIAVGDFLKIDATGAVVRNASPTGNPAHMTALKAIPISTTATINVFLRLA